MNDGLALLIYDPLWISPNFVCRLEPNDLELEQAAIGGCIVARCSFAMTQIEAELWFERGIGRHVEIVDAWGLVWQGFVNLIEMNLGRYVLTRGPLTDVCNRCVVNYSSQDDTGASSGVLPTKIANDLVSQRLYGIWDQTLSAGTMSGSADEARLQAEQASETYIYWRGVPAMDEGVGPEQTGATCAIKLEMAGYWEFYKAFPFDADAKDGLTSTISAKVAAVLALDPNHLIASSSIATNPLLVSAVEKDAPLAQTLLTTMADMGGANYQRYLVGVDRKRRFYYLEAPTNLSYLQRFGATGVNFTLPNGAEIKPWRVQPGHWLRITDLFVGLVPETPDRHDTRFMFIERVNYRMPNEIQISTSRISNLTVRLKSMGLVSN